MSETRIVHFTVDPALQAYMEHLAQTGRKFSRRGYDRFAEGYRARQSQEDAAPERAAAGGT